MSCRAVIYARYSSEAQKEASIEDQIRICKEIIEREGWGLVGVFSDQAISGSTVFRPGYQKLLEGGREHEFDVVVAEALDRLSRDQEHVAGLYKQMKFGGIDLVTVAEGPINELHVGLKGTMNALFLKDLALKTHRGLRGRVEQGRSAGGISYGYKPVRRVDARGEIIRGKRAIDPTEAEIVRRIFGMFADGMSPIAIAKALNEQGIAGPGGREWRDTTIRGHGQRGTGILRNELYVGRLVWNRMHFIKDPATGKRVSRMNPKDLWVVEDVPELRVVDDETWEAVQARLAEIRTASGADDADRPRFWERRRADHLLTGKVFCGCCNGAMSNIGKDYLGCSKARRQGTCANKRSVRREPLEVTILAALRERLMQPEHVATFVEEFTAEWNRQAAEASAERSARTKQLEKVERKLSGLINAIADGIRSAGIQQELLKLEERKAGLERDLSAGPVAEPPRLHPNLAEVYRDRVLQLHEAMRSGDGRATLEQVRRLIDRVIIHPADGGGGYEIELIGEIAAMVDLAMTAGKARPPRVGGIDRDLFSRSVKVVAGPRNQF